MKTYRMLEEGEIIQRGDEFTPPQDFKYSDIYEFKAGTWYACDFIVWGAKMRAAYLWHVRRPVSS